jgi:hypothetical protein
MHLICTWYADICRKYAMNMQKYAQNMQKICRNMHLICTWYAIKYARNMQEYARICIGAYFAYFAYICTPHFADAVTRIRGAGPGDSVSLCEAAEMNQVV